MNTRNKSFSLSDWGDNPPPDGFMLNGRSYLDIMPVISEHLKNFPNEDRFQIVTLKWPRIPGTDPEDPIWNIYTSKGIREVLSESYSTSVKSGGYEVRDSKR